MGLILLSLDMDLVLTQKEFAATLSTAQSL